MKWRGVAAGVAVTFATSAAAAQATPTVVVQGPAGNPVTDALATFTITASNFLAADLPLRVQLQLASAPDFSQLLADTTINGVTATVTVPRLLPTSGALYWRAFALTARAGSVPSAVTGPITVPVHLRLVSPNNPAGQSLTTRRPTFTWRSSRVPPAFGAWDYELRIEETATGRARVIATTTDTAITLSDELESNTSYRWRVRARLASVADSVSALSAGTFVILSDGAPLTTLLHNPFPSPFPLGAVGRTCLWFDLAIAGPVTLTVLDMRGLVVRRIVPGTTISGAFAAGRYGRPSPGATSGCDDRFSWDGTDTNGRTVPRGVYLIHLRAGGRDYRRQVVFDGGR